MIIEKPIIKMKEIKWKPKKQNKYMYFVYIYVRNCAKLQILYDMLYAI